MKDVALYIAGTLFLLMSVMQFLRVIYKVKIVVNDRINIPVWICLYTAPALLAWSIFLFYAASR